MTSDKRNSQALHRVGKQFVSLKNSRSVRICCVLNRSTPGHFSVLSSRILRVLLTKHGIMAC